MFWIDFIQIVGLELTETLDNSKHSLKRNGDNEESTSKEKQTYEIIQMPPTTGMAPHISPHKRPTTCRIQCRTSPSWSWKESNNKNLERNYNMCKKRNETNYS